MGVVELINELSRLGVELAVVGDQLKIDAPAATVTDDLRQLIKQRKIMLIWAVRSWPAHQFARCDQCGQCQLIRKQPKADKCIMTPGCRGLLTGRTPTWRPSRAAS